MAVAASADEPEYSRKRNLPPRAGQGK